MDGRDTRFCGMQDSVSQLKLYYWLMHLSVASNLSINYLGMTHLHIMWVKPLHNKIFACAMSMHLASFTLNIGTYSHAIHLHVHTHTHTHHTHAHTTPHTCAHNTTHTPHTHAHTTPHTHAHSRLSVLYEYHRVFKIQPTHLTNLINHIVKNTPGLSQSNHDIIGDSSANEWSNLFLNDLQSIVTESMAVMDDHLALFNTKASDDIEYLKGLLQ